MLESAARFGLKQWFTGGLPMAQLMAYGVSVAVSMGSNLVLVLILVRLLPASVYSGVVLTKVSLLVITSLGGLGLSQAAVRWVNLREDSAKVLGTVLGGTALLALPAAAGLVGLIAVFEDWLGLSLNPEIAAGAVLLVCCYMVNNELVGWARACHRSDRYALLNTARAVFQVGAVSVGVLATREASGYIYGLAFGELAFFLMLLFSARRRVALSFRRALLGDMLRYGWPHTLVIASGFLLTYADRYMLAFMVEDRAVVAYYDAAYMVVSSVLALLVRPFNLFLFPAYVRRYAEDGREATLRMLNRAQMIFLLAGISLATALTIVRVPLLEWLLPSEYSVASSIFVAVAYGVLLNGVFMSSVAGLYISQQTLMVGISAIVALILNVAANLILIPLMGINGAAISTAIAFAAQLAVGYRYARGFLPVKLPLNLLVGGGAWLGVVYWLTGSG